MAERAKRRGAIAVVATVAAVAASAAPASAANVITDGGFESATRPASGGLDSPAWTESDNVFGSPLCSVALCGNASGTIGPHQGANWGSFGASGKAQLARVTQLLPMTTEGTWVGTLGFHVWTGVFQDAGAEFEASVNGLPVFRLDASNQAQFAGGYTPVSVPVKFTSRTPGGNELWFDFYSPNAAGGKVTSINLDDVALDLVPWNEFLLEEGLQTRRDAARGIGRLHITVPGPGRVTVSGKQVARTTKDAVEVDQGLNMQVKAKGKAKKKLRSQGKVKVKATVTYTPTGGAAASKAAKVTLRMR